MAGLQQPSAPAPALVRTTPSSGPGPCPRYQGSASTAGPGCDEPGPGPAGPPPTLPLLPGSLLSQMGGWVQRASPFSPCTHPAPWGLVPGKASLCLCHGPFARGQVGEVTELWELAGGRVGLTLARRPLGVGFTMGCGLGARSPKWSLCGEAPVGLRLPWCHPQASPLGMDGRGERRMRLCGPRSQTRAPHTSSRPCGTDGTCFLGYWRACPLPPGENCGLSQPPRSWARAHLP